MIHIKAAFNVTWAITQVRKNLCAASDWKENC